MVKWRVYSILPMLLHVHEVYISIHEIAQVVRLSANLLIILKGLLLSCIDCNACHQF